MLNPNRFLVLVFIITIITGCSIQNNTATLSTQNKSISSSIKDLEKNLVESETQMLKNNETQAEYIFTYQKDSPEKISKITINKSYENSKKIHHFYLSSDQKVTHVNSEDHVLKPNLQTKLTNHSFKIDEMKVLECLYGNSEKLDPTNPKAMPLVEEIESELEYIYSTLIDSPIEEA